MPGAIELVHPNKFLPSKFLRILWLFIDLRPVEEFRHTPIIPISEKDLSDYKKSIDERNRKGYYVEIKKDTLYFYAIALISLGVISYVFLMVNEKNIRLKSEVERSR